MNKISDEIDGEGLGEFADAGASWERREAARLAKDGGKARRKPGRPKGAKNKRTNDLLALQEERGYADPVEAMMQYCSLPAEELHAWICERVPKKQQPSLWRVMQDQNAMRVQLAPYLHAKIMAMPAALEELLPMLFMNLGTNQLDQARQVSAQKALSVGSPLLEQTSNKNNDLDD